MIRMLAPGAWWIHEVLIRSISMWGRCFVTGSAGLGVVQGHVKRAPAARTTPRFVQNVEKSWGRASCWEIEIGKLVSSPCQWEMCKIWWAKTQQEIFWFRNQNRPGKSTQMLGDLCSFYQDLASLKMGMFSQAKLTPLRAANMVCVVWGVIAPTSQLKTLVSLDEAQGGIYILQKSILWAVGQESSSAHTHPLKKTLPSISMLPFWPLRQDFLLQLNSKCFINSSSVCKWTLKIDYFLFVSFGLQMFLPLWGRQLFC